MGTKSAIEYEGTLEQMLVIATIALKSAMASTGSMRTTIYAPKITELFAERYLLLPYSSAEPASEYRFTLRVGKKGVFKARPGGIFAPSCLNETLRLYFMGLCVELSLPYENISVTSMPRGKTEFEGHDYFLELLLHEAEDGTKIVLSLPMTDDILSPDELQFRTQELCGVLYHDMHITHPEELGALITFALYVYGCLLGQCAPGVERKFSFDTVNTVIVVKMYGDGPKFFVSIHGEAVTEMEKLRNRLNRFARIHY